MARDRAGKFASEERYDTGEGNRLSTKNAKQPLNSEANNHDPGPYGQEVDTIIRHNGVIGPLGSVNSNPSMAHSKPAPGDYPEAGGIEYGCEKHSEAAMSDKWRHSDSWNVRTGSFARWDVKVDRENANAGRVFGNEANGDYADVREPRAHNMYDYTNAESMPAINPEQELGDK
jgi:hypothetical protein